jgi:hypothetical protein
MLDTIQMMPYSLPFDQNLETPTATDMSSFLWLKGGTYPVFLWWIYGNPSL